MRHDAFSQAQIIRPDAVLWLVTFASCGYASSANVKLGVPVLPFCACCRGGELSVRVQVYQVPVKLCKVLRALAFHQRHVISQRLNQLTLKGQLKSSGVYYFNVM